MSIDGTWRRDCTLEDVSDTGAKLTVNGSIEGLHLKEFFLLLSSTGLAYRRCALVWVNGDKLGVSFLRQGVSKKPVRRGPSSETVDTRTIRSFVPLEPVIHNAESSVALSASRKRRLT